MCVMYPPCINPSSVGAGASALRQLRRSVRVRGLLCLSKLHHGRICARGGRSAGRAGDSQGFLLDVLQQQR